MNKINVILIGPPGSGKSILAHELKYVLKKFGVKRVISRQRPVLDGEHAEVEWSDDE